MLDFGRYIAAPYCAMVLADMGAEVIRVERPGGEEDRRLGLEAANGESFTFTSLARGKKAVTLDLRRGGPAREVLADLVARSDVVVHNFAPAAAAAFGVTYEDVRAIRPDVVYAGISFCGADGPYASRTGFDPIAQMISGAASVTGGEAEPTRAGVPWVDYGTGLSAALGIVVALRRRDATGLGQAIDCALLLTALSFTAPVIAEATVAGRERPRLGNQAAYIAPSNLYRCLDGHVYVTAVTPGMWRALTAAVGRPELGLAPELRTAEQRFEQRDRVDAVVEEWTASRTVAGVVAVLEAAQVPCGAYRRTTEVLADEAGGGRRLIGFADLEVPGLECVPVSPTPFRLSAVGAPPAGRPPRVGEHNDEVYGGVLGYARPRRAELRAAGVI